MKNYKILAEKVFWSLAPFVWGRFIWSLVYSLVPYCPLNYLLRALLVSGIIILFFRSTFDKALNYELKFFDYSIKLPPWWIFIILVIISTSLNFFIPFNSDLIQVLIYDMIFSTIIEGFITQSFFIKYRMGILEFIIFNIISSLSFSFMHFGTNYIQLLSLHFGFSFILGIIVYKTQRIEFSIILHMLSNLLRYFIPVCILHCAYPSLIPTILSMLFDIIFLLSLAGCSYKYRVIK